MAALDPFDRAMVEAKLIKDPRRAKMMKSLGLTIEEIAAVLLGNATIDEALAGTIREGDEKNEDGGDHDRQALTATGRKRPVALRGDKTLDAVALEILKRNPDRAMSAAEATHSVNSEYTERGVAEQSSVANALRRLVNNKKAIKVGNSPPTYKPLQN